MIHLEEVSTIISNQQVRVSSKPVLSVIIVNYNVKYFLEHALYSIRKASENIHIEVFVVDNNSSDGSVEMLKLKFPEVNVIANKQNLGFSKANNQAILQSSGEHILLLNPDTVVQEDTFEKCIEFMESHPDAGALGVKMVDGSGKFLPESKRALPTPTVAFFKLSGLSSLFPKSKLFGQYHLSFLSQDQTHEVQVLAGAFMWIRKSVLETAGLLDEDFFMYGEDIDLSYRITQTGLKNYYFPETRIIHYKGESTKKGSLNYVRMFFNAMAIFADKHYSSGTARWYHIFIRIAIFFSAIVSALRNVVNKATLPAMDALVSFAGIYLIQDFWGSNIKNTPEYYPDEFIFMVLPVYILIWLVTGFFSGSFDKPFRISPILRGVFFGTFIVAAAYGFFPEEYRFSRAIIILGAGWIAISMLFNRMLFNGIRNKTFTIEYVRKPIIAIVGSSNEANRSMKLMQDSGIVSNIVGYVLPGGEDRAAIGKTSQLPMLVELYRVNELIFCAKDLASKDIIDWMSRLGPAINYKILPEDGFSIIGSHSKNTPGEIHAVDLNLSIDTSRQRRNKRVFDLLIAALVLALFPLSILHKRTRNLLMNSFAVLIGKRTWVGYAKSELNSYNLPKLSASVIPLILSVKSVNLPPETIDRINLMYAKEYSVESDFRVLRRYLKGPLA